MRPSSTPRTLLTNSGRRHIISSKMAASGLPRVALGNGTDCIAPLEMLLNPELLRHANCSRMARERRGSDEAISYGGKEGAEVCFSTALPDIEPRMSYSEFVAIAGAASKACDVPGR